MNEKEKQILKVTWTKFISYLKMWVIVKSKEQMSIKLYMNLKVLI